MADYYLAIDLGASGGRHILGQVEGGKLVLEEVHRFSNSFYQKDGSLIWDLDLIFSEITEGLEKCGAFIKGRPGEGTLRSVGIDTWGVDYALLDKEGKLIAPAFAYRDSRTEPFLETSMPYEELYKATGIARQPFNTIYQVLADKAAGRLEKAEYMLQLPEYFSQRLTGNLMGKEHNEYTMASTTGLLDAAKKDWAKEVFEKLDLPARLFKPLREPPYDIGCLSAELQERLGFNARVLMIASHDTASAVATVEEGSLYISSGTWSLWALSGTRFLAMPPGLRAIPTKAPTTAASAFLKTLWASGLYSRYAASLRMPIASLNLKAWPGKLKKPPPQAGPSISMRPGSSPPPA